MPVLRSKPTSGVLLWDIDGTLIRTKRPNSSSPHKNVLRRRGYRFDEAKVGLSGFTDYEVFLELVNNRDELSETQLRSIFYELDEEARILDRGSTFDLYPGVQATLESLASFGWTHGILTGNTSPRMMSKLKLAGIADYFTEEFLFSCKFGESRKDITRNAREVLNYNKHLRVLILGDTPKDISAGQLSNFPIISIATGIFSVSDLSRHNPDLVIRNLEDDAHILLEFLKVFP
jgi:phosphoglycolate phosphatase